MSRRRPMPKPDIFRQDYFKIKAQCKQQGILFEDPKFPANDSSLMFSRTPVKRIVWKRPTEICSNPIWIVKDGGSRLDVVQGDLNDGWLLAAAASLTAETALFERVVDRRQDFTTEYCGLFKFKFWVQGEWEEVVVDDRLPTYNNQLIYTHSGDKNEFWSALLEKAYAKLSGSYESLKGGRVSEAMIDFTGGVAEKFDLKKTDQSLMAAMIKAQARCSLMGCSIESGDAREKEILPSGLVKGHYYSVTSVKMMDITTSRSRGKIPMVRLRNTWGDETEWKGAWSDKSREWQFISTDERTSIGLTFDNEGEFWMSFTDFVKHFDTLEMCHLGPDSMSDADGKFVSWEGRKDKGAWVRRVSAGGCRNYLDTFWTNPQFRMTLTDPDEDDDENMCTVVIALMQMNMRKKKERGLGNLTIGYTIYELDDTVSSRDVPLDVNFFKYNASDERSPSFTNSREVCGRHKLKPGKYLIVPSTFEPNQEADFLLRIFTETPSELGPSDVVSRFDRPEQPEDSPEDARLRSGMHDTFMRMAGDDEEIDVYELKDILNAAFSREFEFDGFSTDLTKSLVAMYDVDNSGKLGYPEFESLWNRLRMWKGIFKKYDMDKSGQFNSYELRNALMGAGFKLSNDAFRVATIRFCNKAGKIEFDDFVLLLAKLTISHETFNRNVVANNRAQFSLEEFLLTTINL